jgi:hypothetical protein
MNLTGKGGLKDFSEERRKEVARKGGLAKNPNKGFGSLTKKERKANAQRAANIRWENYRDERTKSETETSVGSDNL